MTEVFVSYKRENLAAVGRLVEVLRAEGVGVWWDQDIPANAAWEATIEAALAAAKLVIVAWSPAAVASENVKAEARWARGQGRLLQVFVEPCEPPLFFGERQGLDLKGWSGGAADPAFRAVLEAINGGLRGSPSEAPAVEPANAPLALPSKPSIAVLPFADPAGAKEEDYFADGIVEEISTALSRFPTLFVIDSGSSLTFRGSAKSPRQIAQELGVHYVLEGAVRRSGPKVRITVQLLDAADGAQVWAERFEGALDDVFALQDEVAALVAGQIEPNIHASDVRRIERSPTSNLTAYQLWLRGRELIRRLTFESVTEARELFERAIALDPNYGRALGYLAGCLAMLDAWEPSEAGDSLRVLMSDYCDRALASGPDDPEVLTWAAHTYWLSGRDASAARVLSDRALALNPNHAMAWYVSGASRVQAGDYQQAIADLQRHLRLDPKSIFRGYAHNLMGASLLGLGRTDEAVALIKEGLELSRSNPYAWIYLAAAYTQLGRLDEARRALDSIDRRQHGALRVRISGPIVNGLLDDALKSLGADA
jgi:TolB-like protein/Tfp pilus assembly protein PilF